MQGFDSGNDIIILFYAVMVGNLSAPVCLPVITGMMCGVVAAFFLCRNLNDYRKVERSVNQRRR